MTKIFYSIALLTVACLALMFTFSPSQTNAEPLATPGDAYAASPLNTNDADLYCSNQSEAPGLILALAEAQAGEHRCVRHCRRHYEERVRECNEPGHPHHRRCEHWARERERDCLDKCYREYRY